MGKASFLPNGKFKVKLKRNIMKSSVAKQMEKLSVYKRKEHLF